MVVLAPAVQWWFAINGFVEMLIFAQLSIILLKKYMLTKNYVIRTGCVHYYFSNMCRRVCFNNVSFLDGTISIFNSFISYMGNN